jgi:hypothetical protein
MPQIAAVGGALLVGKFAAPALVTALGASGSAFATAAITTAVSALGGGLGSVLAGGEFGQGALIGGTAGLISSAAPLLGASTTAAGEAAATAAGTQAPATAGLTTAGEVATTQITQEVAKKGLLDTAIASLSDPAALTQLAITVFGAPPQSLTAQEEALLAELQQTAATNEQLFETKVAEAESLMQMAEQQAPRPEQAYAQTKIAAERQLAEQTRGMGGEEAAFAQRRSGIRSAQAGATATAAEEARGRQTQTQLMQAGLAALPGAAPEGYAGLALPTYESLQERQYSFYDDLAETAGDIFGSIAPAGGGS